MDEIKKTSIKDEFIQIGKNSRIVMALNLIYSLGFLNSLGYLGLSMFGYYGSNNPLSTLFSILQFIAYIGLFAVSFFLFKMTRGVKRINDVHNNISLRTFRSNLVFGQIINLIVAVISIISSIVQMYVNSIYAAGGDYYDIPYGLYAWSSLSMYSFYGGIIGSIMVTVGWKNLEEFFRFNTGMFPNNIGVDATFASKHLKTANILGIMIFIPLVPFILSQIFFVYGYFNLSKSLQKLENSREDLIGEPRDFNDQRMFQQSPIQNNISSSQPINITPKEQNFCRKCGAPMTGDAIFCETCGVAKS